MANLKGVYLFLDFDNTLMRTEELVLPSFIERFNELYGNQIDHPLTLEEFKQHFHGQARTVLCENLSNHFGIQINEKVLYENRELVVEEHYGKKGVEMADNLLPILDKLTSEGITLTCVTNSPLTRIFAAMRSATNKMGSKLAGFFGDRFFESGEIQKPKPHVYNHAMRKLGITSSYAIAVEDSVTGIQAAKGAGIKVFGYLGLAKNQDAERAKLSAAGATECFTDWKDFPALLEKYVATQPAPMADARQHQPA